MLRFIILIFLHQPLHVCNRILIFYTYDRDQPRRLFVWREDLGKIDELYEEMTTQNIKQTIGAQYGTLNYIDLSSFQVERNL